MQRQLPARFWFEVIAAELGTVLFVLTLVTREWIEILTGFDPDGGSGRVDFALAIGLLVIAVTSTVIALREFRRAPLLT